MNDWRDEIPVEDDWWLDLLVDDELNHQQRGRLLEFLDRQPDGWRRCALAFLESQSLAGDLRALHEARTAVGEPGRAIGRARPLRILAVAASLVLAFSLGMVVRGQWSRGQAPVVQAPDATAEQDQGRPGFGSPTEAVSASAFPVGQLGALTWLFDEAGSDTLGQIHVPLVDASHFDEDVVWELPPPLPADVLRALQRMGHRIEQTRRTVALNLSDDRQIVVPVEELTIVPVDYRAY